MLNVKANGHDASSSIIPWPASIEDTGMYGLAGEFVRLVAPHTEGDSNIILLAFLTMAGNVLGRKFYVRAGADRHCGNLYLCPVGTTGTGRKGSGVAAAQTFFSEGPYAPKLPRILYGISSGEGIMSQIRDQKTKQEWNRKTSKFEEIVIDKGIEDKRVLVSLGEFQQYIAAMRRQDSILSSVLRQAWDKGSIGSPSKNNEITVTDAHVSMIGCISKEELLAETLAVDAQNGTLNRFNFACSQRSRLLPEGGDFDQLITSDPWRELQQRFTNNITEPLDFPIHMRRDTDTQDDWGRNIQPGRGLYKLLSEPRLGLWGAVTARAAQQVIRFSMITAVINGYRQIQIEHQLAAWEIWRYCDHSARYIFGDRLNDPLSARIMAALRDAGSGGFTRNQIQELLHRPSAEIHESLQHLAEAGIAYYQTRATGGRPVEVWFASL